MAATTGSKKRTPSRSRTGKASAPASNKAPIRKSTARTPGSKVAPAKRAAAKKTAAKRSPTRASARAATRTASKQETAAIAPPERRQIPESTRQMVAAAADACVEKKAEDTRILELDSSDAGFTDFFLITSGTNERQTQSIADEIEMRMKHEFGTYPNSVEGKRQGEWVLLDYVDFVVHIFLAEKRAFYDIERLRKSATLVDLKELQASLTPRQPAVSKATAKAATKKKAPAAKKSIGKS